MCVTEPFINRMRRLALLAIFLIAMLPACAHPGPGIATTASPIPAQPIPTITSDVRDQRGTIVSSTKMQALSPPLSAAGATQYKVVYRSTSGIDGTGREVSGTVFVPPGTPPSGGWPVIAYGHGETGIADDCGPSFYPDLMGYDLVVASLLNLNYVVALTDYEGLGHPGVHPFLEPRTAAFNLIDSVRAAREVVPGASARWLAVGVSQGGQASWAANELAREYGEGLNFLGSASLSPAVDLSRLPALAESGWLSKAQQVLLPTLVSGLKATHPDLSLDDYLHGALARNQDVWLACAGPLAEQQSTAVGELTTADSEPASAKATEALQQALFEYALPQRPADGPMLVITGDGDDKVLPQWVASAVKKACDLGDAVEFVIRPKEGHDNLNGGPRVAQWLNERLAGKPPMNTCGT